MTPHPVKWVPPWAAGQVEASHTEWKPGDTQDIHARCLRDGCGAELVRKCDAGNARHWISVFASTHARLHA